MAAGSDCIGHDLRVQMVRMGLITRENMHHYGLDIELLTHSNGTRCRNDHDGYCYRAIEWDLLIQCIQSGVVVDNDLSCLKWLYPDTYWQIQHQAGIVPVHVLDDFLSDWLEREFKPDDNIKIPNSRWGISYIIDGYAFRLYDILYELNDGSKHIDYHWQCAVSFGKSDSYNPLKQYPKTLDWFRRIYQLENCYHNGDLIFDLFSELQLPSQNIDNDGDSFEAYVDIVIMLLDLGIITSSNFRNKDILTNMFMGEMQYYKARPGRPAFRRWEYYHHRNGYTAISGFIFVIRRLASIGIIPGVHYDFEDNDGNEYGEYQVRIDKEISDYCMKVYDTFNTLQGRCVIMLLNNNIDLTAIPRGFYMKFSQFIKV